MTQRLGLLGGARAGQGCQPAPQNSPRIAGLLPDHLPDQHRPGQRLGHPDADGLGEHEGRLGQRAALLCDHRAGSRADVPDPLPVPVAGRAHHTENRHQRQHRHQQDGRLLHLLRRRADRRDGHRQIIPLAPIPENRAGNFARTHELAGRATRRNYLFFLFCGSK